MCAELNIHFLKLSAFISMFLSFPGMRFAMLQIKAAICELVKNFEIQSKSNTVHVPSGWFFFTDMTTEIVLNRL